MRKDHVCICESILLEIRFAFRGVLVETFNHDLVFDLNYIFKFILAYIYGYFVNFPKIYAHKLKSLKNIENFKVSFCYEIIGS